jgi:SprT protein
MMTRSELQEKLYVSQIVRNKVDTVIQDCIFMAEKMFGVGVKVPEVRYDLVGKAAGQAIYRRIGGSAYVIRINPILLNENEEYVINQTIPHEMAHIVVYQFYHARGIDVNGHGKEWKRVMRHFGLEPNRCHNMNVTTVNVLKKRTEYKFKCGCVGNVYVLSKNKYTRWANGTTYTCRKCNTQIRFDSVVKHGYSD